VGEVQSWLQVLLPLLADRLLGVTRIIHVSSMDISTLLSNGIALFWQPVVHDRVAS